MKHSIYFIAIATVLFASCTQPFKKTDNGIEYKVISDGKGAEIKSGQFFEIQFDQVYKGNNKDTVLFSSKDFTNQIVALDSNAIPPVYYNIFKQIRKGDSIIVKQMTDSIMKQGNTPPFMKKGAHIFAHYKIVNIFETRTAADSAYNAGVLLAKAKDSAKAIEQLKKDDKIIADYLAKNNIQTVKGTLGTYVQVLTPGEGDAIDTSKVLKVYYTGKTLEDGKVFDSNVDPKFKHTEIFPVYMGAPEGAQGSVIKGWTDGLSLLKKGAKANLYVPSSLAYGTRGAGADIKANANLVFEVEVKDVVSTTQARAEAEVERKQMEAQQKKTMDSLQKAQKDTLKK